MKPSLYRLLIVLGALSFSQCVEVPDSDRGAGSQHPGHAKRLVAEMGRGEVTIREEGRVLTTFRTAMPNVEGTRWHKHQEEIAVKSRGNHGPATIQLFDSRNGRELGKVMAFQANHGPAWARDMAE